MTEPLLEASGWARTTLSEAIVTAQTTLIVPVPEMSVPNPCRMWSPRPAAMAPHVTVMFPFLAPCDLDEVTIDKLGLLFGTVRSFSFSMERTGTFGEVLWVAPEPADAFRQLTQMVQASWPSVAPYGGAFQEVVPHVTIGQARFGRRPSRRLLARLPIEATAREVKLLATLGRGWTEIGRFPFAET
ncbi:MAG: 2'-5' RNA ligase family protein [Acidimicrobiales bacterium]